MKPILIMQIPLGLTIGYNQEEIEKDYILIIVRDCKDFQIKIISKPGDYAH
jgi:hypothetical protein